MVTQTRASKPLEKVLNVIYEHINTGSLLPGDPLPTKTELAARAKVSPHTALKACAMLKQEGILEGSRGHRYRLCSSGDFSLQTFQPQHSEKTQSFSSPVWVKIKKQLERDILNGVFHAGFPLPSVKELLARYNISYPTLKKALESIASDDILEPHRRGYAVKATSGKKSSGTLLLLCPGNTQGEFPANAINETFLRTVGTECAKRRFSLVSAAYFIEKNKLKFSSVIRGIFDDIRELGDIYGFLVLILESSIKPEPKAILHYLSAFHKPMAVFDQLGEWKVSDYYQQSDKTKFFEVSTSENCGRIAGRYCLEKKHTNVAYISPYHRSIWSIKRLAGLAGVFHKAGFSRGVSSYTFTGTSDYTLYQDREQLLRRYNLQPVLDTYERWTTSADPLALREIEPVMRSLKGKVLPHIEFIRCLRVLFDRALAEKRHTAWIASNDTVAIEAMRYCLEKNIAVPSQLSIMGFDNTYASIWYGITSYDFNISALIHAMLDYVLHPLHTKWSGKKPVQIEGIMVERHSMQR